MERVTGLKVPAPHRRAAAGRSCKAYQRCFEGSPRAWLGAETCGPGSDYQHGLGLASTSAVKPFIRPSKGCLTASASFLNMFGPISPHSSQIQTLFPIWDQRFRLGGNPLVKRLLRLAIMLTTQISQARPRKSWACLPARALRLRRWLLLRRAEHLRVDMHACLLVEKIEKQQTRSLSRISKIWPTRPSKGPPLMVTD